MADSRSFGIPWAGVVVLAAFIGSTQLVPHAFDQLRPPEKERAQTTLNAELEVDARLWEDPFAALRRYEAERVERCDKASKGLAAGVDCALRSETVRRPESLRIKLDRNENKDLSEALVLLALVPGNPFVGAEEARRRTRYAILAGLQAQGYVPENAERIGLLEFELSQLTVPNKGSAAMVATANPTNPTKPVELRKFVVPFELLVERRLMPNDNDKTGQSRGRRYQQVALLWVDEAALPSTKLTALARMLDGMFGPRVVPHEARCETENRLFPRLAVIGPSSTDALRIALSDLQRARAQFASLGAQLPEPYCSCQTNPKSQRCEGLSPEKSAVEGYRLLARADIYNSASTAPSSMLDELKTAGTQACLIAALAKKGPTADRNTEEVSCFVNDEFAQLFGVPDFDKNRVVSKDLTKKKQADCLNKKVGSRCEQKKTLIAVDFERTIGTDDVLIDRLVAELKIRLPADAKRRVVLVAERDSLYSQSLVSEFKQQLKKSAPLATLEVAYFFRGLDGVTTRDVGRDSSDKTAPKSSAPDARLEWPESRDQLDYLRRLSQSLKQSERVTNGVPIGAIGILANDVHDKLLVLQALHDTFSDKMFFTTDMDARFLHPRSQAFTRNLIVASSLPLEFYTPPGKDAVDLQAGTPPLRDVYQTATYLAARRAGCRDEECAKDERAAGDLALKNTSLYEVGRNRAVPLGGYALVAHPPQGGVSRLLVAGAMLLLMLGGLLGWPSTPAIRQANQALRRRSMRGDMRMGVPNVILVALHAALFAYLLCTLIEFVRPRQMSFVVPLLSASLSAFAVLLALLPALPGRRGSGVDRFHLGTALIVLLAGCWLVWAAGNGAAAQICDECEPVTWLEGVSAWPSHLIHLLALMAILYTLDVTWSDTQRMLRQDSEWLRLSPPQAHPLQHAGMRVLLRDWAAHVSIMSWRRKAGPTNSFVRLWVQYGERGASRPRAARVLVWYLITAGLVGALYYALSEGEMLVVPARGVEHHRLVQATLNLVSWLLPLLVVAVADATMLACRFIGHLNAGRTAWVRCMPRSGCTVSPAHRRCGRSSILQRRRARGCTPCSTTGSMCRWWRAVPNTCRGW